MGLLVTMCLVVVGLRVYRMRDLSLAQLTASSSNILQLSPPPTRSVTTLQCDTGAYYYQIITFRVFLPFIRRSESSQRQRRHNRKAISANNGVTHKVYGSEKKIKVDAENGIHANGNINESCT